MNIVLPRYLCQCRSPGAYLVGGSVRDLILGITPLDYDIAVDCDPNELAQRIAKQSGGRVVLLGQKRFPVYRVVSNQGGVDITTYKGLNIRQDLEARDFTINAMACDLSDGRVIDITGGLQDLHDRVIRMVSSTAFQEDPVRLVRAFRIAALLGFSIDPETARAIGEHAKLIAGTAGERIWSELIRILACPNVYPILLEMANTMVLFNILPELALLRKDIQIQNHTSELLNHSLKYVQALERLLQKPGITLPPEPARFVEKTDDQTRALLKFTVLLQAIGTYSSRCENGDSQVQLDGHGADGAEHVQIIARRLRMSNRHREQVAVLVRRQQDPLSLYMVAQNNDGSVPQAVARFFRQCGESTPYLIILALADNLSTENPNSPFDARLINFLQTTIASYFEKKLDRGLPPVLTGHDLIERFNLKSSPLIGALLRRVRELQLSGTITHRTQAFQWVAGHLALSQQDRSNSIL